MTSHQTVMLLLDLALILVLARVLGLLAIRIGQPAVIGEVLAGIIVGPTLWHGAISDTLFPVPSRPSLSALANVGVAVFMFIIGLELDRTLIKGEGRTAVLVSTLSIALPFGLGTALATYLYQDHRTTNELAFVLFLGAAMSVTAFPVLARILSDRGLQKTRLGTIALASAAIGDVLAWCLLATVVAISGSGTGSQLLILGLIPYVAVMFFVVRPLLRKLIARYEWHGLSLGVLATVLAGLLVSGALTEWMGLHFIFGAFLFGIIIPREGADKLRKDIIQQVGQVNAVLLLPVYFIVAGFNVDLSQLDASGLLALALILVVAISGKFVGAFTGSRLSGLPARDSAVLGTLMNTRGLTELIILSIGLQLGVLDKDLYSLMVVMAVVTTAMAGPLLSLVHPQQQPAEEYVPVSV
ncbi:cation:proton antiporter domain-containing protein [Streptomyces sp. 8L]|uniref:cation:proton antiporter domain-containing protein n=1 Tax=Streptomyces sp. 8L TaxID=2877242 RepID=UPI001CD62CA7|nr:cation:proton antiporter [Streptomyces sp. 8L]MCA1217792.1 cation:proton antiporter [Streptomyces sp. 8L]